VPFLLLPVRDATIVAVGVTLVFLFVMGAYLGALVRERIAYTGLRFVVAGLATALVLWLLRGGTV
jgi:predicted membrane protein (TIGR00267 family)